MVDQYFEVCRRARVMRVREYVVSGVYGACGSPYELRYDELACLLLSPAPLI